MREMRAGEGPRAPKRARARAAGIAGAHVRMHACICTDMDLRVWTYTGTYVNVCTHTEHATHQRACVMIACPITHAHAHTLARAHTNTRPYMGRAPVRCRPRVRKLAHFCCKHWPFSRGPTAVTNCRGLLHKDGQPRTKTGPQSLRLRLEYHHLESITWPTSPASPSAECSPQPRLARRGGSCRLDCMRSLGLGSPHPDRV